MSKSRFKIIPVVNIILESDGKLLLMKRTDGFFKGGFWVVPGGHVDGNETLPEATVRELKEELDIDVQLNDVKVVHVVHNLETDREKLDFFVKVSEFSGTIKNCEPKKCEELKFFGYDALPSASQMASTTLLALSGISNGTFYSERGFAEGKPGFSEADKLTFDNLQSRLIEVFNRAANNTANLNFSDEILKLLNQSSVSEADIKKCLQLILLLAASRDISLKNAAYEIFSSGKIM